MRVSLIGLARALDIIRENLPACEDRVDHSGATLWTAADCLRQADALEAEVARLTRELDEARALAKKTSEQCSETALERNALRADNERLRAEPVKCPVCDGHGTVSRPPWVAGDQHSWPGSTAGGGPWPCRACGGIGIVTRAALAEEGEL